MSIAITLHLLAALLWVGGMLFAYLVLRPAAADLLEPPLRLTLWANIFTRFFPWVGLSIIVLLVSGFWMIFGFMGGMKHLGPHIHGMMTLGIFMMLLFCHIVFVPFKRLKRAVTEQDWAAGAKQLSQIRILIAVNLFLGLVVVVIASAGRYAV